MTTEAVVGGVRAAANDRPSPFPGIQADTTINAALHLMWQGHVRHLLVHEAGRVVGLASERDLLTAVALGGAAAADPVRAAVLPPTPARQLTASNEELAAAMHAQDSDVLVLCNGTAPVSLITAMDLLAAIFPAATAAARRERAHPSELDTRYAEPHSFPSRPDSV